MTSKHSVSVAGVVTNNKNEVLLIKRADNGNWEIPGGVLENLEKIQEGVHREIMEETGVEVQINFLSGIYKNIPVGVVALVFNCSYVGGDLLTSSESVEVKWVKAENLSSLVKETSVIRIFDSLDYTGSPQIRNHDGIKILD